MELSEAKVKANKFIKAVNQMKDTSNEWHGYDNSELHEIKRFTETFLKALDNSISKEYHDMAVKEQNDIIDDLKSKLDNSISKDEVRKLLSVIETDEEIAMSNEDEKIVNELQYLKGKLQELLGEE